jgi:hypothetical protein
VKQSLWVSGIISRKSWAAIHVFIKITAQFKGDAANYCAFYIKKVSVYFVQYKIILTTKYICKGAARFLKGLIKLHNR